MNKENSTLSPLTISLHWLVGLTMIGVIVIGYYMVYWDVGPLYPIHKALGVLALFIILPRVIWRLKKGFPVPASDYPKHEHQLSVIVHWLLLLGTLALPISGMLYSGFGGYGINIFGFELVTRNELNGEVIAFNETIYYSAKLSHSWIAYILTGALVLHIIGAIKHHVVDQDNTLRRMLGYKEI
ncbi:cytochrome b [Pseudoalteromonas sp. MSK9-3]|uniref:cytochrome b n=1 Tax=Pseudoalteromonas sp. MSK9-3 TaxID=1897633 RepID=UPI000E6C1DB0|nr:cytochrome b [Pseudoalteromonas sp. MSK9-3]RJE71018.1 cytochrome b [Pseudoalteromonas sp. MSK9-3]